MTSYEDRMAEIRADSEAAEERYRTSMAKIERTRERHRKEHRRVGWLIVALVVDAVIVLFVGGPLLYFNETVGAWVVGVGMGAFVLLFLGAILYMTLRDLRERED